MPKRPPSRRAAPAGQARKREASDAERVLTTADPSLLDVVDNVLNKGVVLSGDLTIGLAQVELIYARLSLLLCAADRVFPHEDTEFMARHHKRHMMRIARREGRLPPRSAPRETDSSRRSAKREGDSSRRRAKREGDSSRRRAKREGDSSRRSAKREGDSSRRSAKREGG